MSPSIFRPRTLLGERIPVGVIIALAGLTIAIMALRLIYPVSALMLSRALGELALTLIALTFALGLLRGWLTERSSVCLRPVLFGAVARSMGNAPIIAGSPPRPTRSRPSSHGESRGSKRMPRSRYP